VTSSFFYSSWDECPTNLWTLPTFSELANMTREDLNSPVAAAATALVKLCPYDEEEPHIWFRLIEAQFAAAGIKSQKLKYANALANLYSITLVQYLYISCYLSDNKPVLSYLLWCLLPQGITFDLP
jgi:hypothetical protein